MLLWLKSPQQHFAAMRIAMCTNSRAACVRGAGGRKAGLAQSAASGLSQDLEAGAESRRIGKWTNYRYHRAGVELIAAIARADLNGQGANSPASPQPRDYG